MVEKKLSIILTVLQEGSISKAAKSLYLSQPALSQSIILMEKELSCKLFNRDTSPITLTYEGEIYLQTLLEIQELESNVMKQLAETRNANRGRISLAISPVRAQQLLPWLLPAISQRLPELDLRLVHGTDRAQLISLMLDGKADFCVTSGPVPSKLQFLPLSKATTLLLLPNNHPVTQTYGTGKNWFSKPALNLKEFTDETFIVNYPFQGARAIVDDLFKKNGMHINRYLEIYDYYTILRLVEEDIGIAVVLDINVMPHLQKLNATPFRLTTSTHSQITLCYRKTMYISHLMEQFIELCRDIMKCPPPV